VVNGLQHNTKIYEVIGFKSKVITIRKTLVHYLNALVALDFTQMYTVLNT